MNIKQEALEFIKSHKECVLATASSEGKPEAATVLFAIEDDFTMYFGTDKKYRKYKNLAENKNVAVVVGVAVEEPMSAQIEGQMEFLDDTAEIEKTKEIFKEKNPAMVPFFKFPLVFMRLKPTWLRFLDETKSQEPFQIIP